MKKLVPPHIQGRLNEKHLFYLKAGMISLVFYYGIQVVRQILMSGDEKTNISLQHSIFFTAVFSLVLIVASFRPIPARYSHFVGWLVLLFPLAGFLRSSFYLGSHELVPVLVGLSIVIGLAAFSYLWFLVYQATLFVTLLVVETKIFDNPDFFLYNNTYYLVITFSIIVFVGRMNLYVRQEELELSQEKNARELIESKRFLNLILDHIPIGITWKDKDFTYQGCNRVITKYLGMSHPKDIQGIRDEDLVSDPVTLLEVQADDRKVFDTRTGMFDMIQFQPTGPDSYDILKKAKIPIVNDGKETIGILTTFENITEKILQEEEQKKLESQMQNAQKLESLGVLTGGIAHDFNNFLTGIIGNAELATIDTKGKTPEYLEQIKAASWKAQGLVQQLLDYSGKKMTQDELFSPNHLIEELRPLLATSIRNKNVLKLNLCKDVPAVRGVPAQINQVVMNLIINASESLISDDGRILVETGVGIPSIDILKEFESAQSIDFNDYMFIRVTDDGEGLSTEAIGKIFDPFYSTKFTGRGLGLAAVQGIVRSHSGHIDVDSEIGEGTVFTIWLPTNSTTKEPTTTHETIVAEPEFPPVEGTVLVVDDDSDILKLTGHLLDHIGYHFQVAESGELGWNLFQQDPEGFSVAIIDMTMPTMSGEQLLQAIRKRSVDFPVLLCSGFDQTEFEDIVSSDPNVDFISKPFNIHELRDKLEKLMLNGNKQAVNG